MDQSRQNDRQLGKGRLEIPLFAGGFAVLLFGLMACKSTGGEHKPTGSPTDPVEVCERSAQVCKFKGSQLGVCVTKPKEDQSCQGKSPCFVCVPQH